MTKPTKKPKGTKKQKPAEKKKYKVRNWKEYNQSLVDRGKVFFWIADEAIEKWQEQQKTGKRGKPKVFSDIAIQTALTLQQVFRMPLRQTEGFITSILNKMGMTLKSPDFTTLCKRTKTLNVAIRVRAIRNEPIHIVADGSGIKVYGEGEWKVRKHGWSKRRTWKKLHIGVDEETGDILLGEVTGNDKADGDVLDTMLEQVPTEVDLGQFSGDGAYDKRKCYDALRNRKVRRITIPPQHNAKIWMHGNSKTERHTRDENLRRIRKIGRKKWKVESNYHRRSLSEVCFFRLKTIFGSSVSARTDESQRTQLLLRCRALNMMTTLGMPKSEAVVA
jgi:hypothetical protein